MRITEVSAGQTIKILISIGDQRMEFDSIVESANPKKNVIYTTPIMRDGKILSFSGNGITANVVVQFPEAKPIVFTNITITTLKKSENAYCYGIISTEEGREINRRGAFRCSVDCKTMMKIGLEKKTHNVILRDVSLTGFSFVFNNDQDACSAGQYVQCMLNDYIDTLNENFSFRLFGQVVRIQELDNGRMVYGCKLQDKVSGLDAYIAKKERSRMHQQRGR